MEDLIEDVGIDGKQSYEDAIIPVTEAYRQYADRISILGGIDVDFLCRERMKRPSGNGCGTPSKCV
jgi:uroporphyrinogen decarboxylase